ncbi:PAS domain-containing sensor histidine kinase [Halobellus sp. Atlit-38R]|uniref:sensor histidine kinase n=1 Tax=Halobellus sp. Atlit-38R TaxID=2282131 RepID=UPI000EF1E522|nr:PAS domain-containing sensor histidine kinase [Halobellus sp. Atlit-38R]RLM87952.1 PAS domain-containing sensor histidine kinase [Halobellus sp. Atlit-38R]
MAKIQLLLAGAGNRQALASLVSEPHTPVTAEEVQEADLHLVDESSFPQYRDELESYKRRKEPVFCPVVLIRRENSPVSVTLPDIESSDRPLVVNDVVTAPVGKQALFRTISNLLVRRAQTKELAMDLKEQNEQLREERRKYQTLVEQSEHGIAVAQDGEFVFVNEQMATIVERDCEALEGMTLESVIAPEYQRLVRRRHQQRTRGESPPTQYEIAVVTPRGEQKDIGLRASRITYDGEPAVLALFRDITAQKERERDLRQFKNAVSHAGHAIMMTDTNGTIEYVNPAFEEMSGYTAAEAIGETPRILKSGDHDEAFYRDLWETILEGEVWTSETVNERKSGERIILNQTIAPIQNGDDEIQGFVAIQDDITDHRLREQQLVVFDRVLRHNLRNKGTAIQGYADILEQTLSDEQSVEHLRTIQDNIDSLLDISEKVHHARQIFADNIEEADSVCGLEAGLERIRDRVESQYTEGNVVIQELPPETVEIDSRVLPGIREFVENGVKHSDASSPQVEIAASVDETTSTISVVDNGSGIPEQEQRVIEAGTEEPLEHGSGLGLWFAYWLVSYVGGDIDIRTSDIGTIVAMTIPIR